MPMHVGAAVDGYRLDGRSDLMGEAEQAINDEMIDCRHRALDARLDERREADGHIEINEAPHVGAQVCPTEDDA